MIFKEGETYPMRGDGTFKVLTTESGIECGEIVGIEIYEDIPCYVSTREKDGRRKGRWSKDLMPPVTEQVITVHWNRDGNASLCAPSRLAREPKGYLLKITLRSDGTTELGEVVG